MPNPFSGQGLTISSVGLIIHICIVQDGTFKLTLEFSEEYPNKPPVMKFLSKMFHANIYADGGICLGILQNRCSQTYDVSANLTKSPSFTNQTYYD